MMHLKDFLQNQQAMLKSSPVIVFCGSSYQPLFFSHFFERLRQKEGAIVSALSVDGTEMDSVYSACQISFLGQQLFYWCKDITSMSDKQKKEWYSFCAQYQGPHILLFFVNDMDIIQKLPNSTVVMLDAIDLPLYITLYRYFFELEGSGTFSVTLFEKRATLSCDEACLMMQYQQIVGKSASGFFNVWFDQILEPSSSLFRVAQYFFARDAYLLMRELSLLEQEYPVEFWLVFWSEQLWQALIFISEAKKSGPLEARKKVSRLPFSFMTKDWKNVSEAELINSHEFLYEADFRMKTGGLCERLDLFYARFLSRTF